MEAKAVAKHVRITPRKARAVVDLVRGKSVAEALAILKFSPRGASEVVYKVVKSAAANAENNFSLDKDSLYISKAYEDAGPTMKRVLPRLRGMADRLLKRSCHVTIVVKEREG